MPRKMKMFEVTIVRTESTSATFRVPATDRIVAEKKAERMAYNHDFGHAGEAEYTIEYAGEIE